MIQTKQLPEHPWDFRPVSDIRSMSIKGLHDTIKPTDMPAPPQAALKIMRACGQQTVSHDELARIASNDPVLAAELLRVVNSPFFGLGRNIQSIPRAITVVGQSTLRNLALCVSVRDALSDDALPGLDTQAFWEDAVRRAVAARNLAARAELDADECFTAGLLQDFGLLVLFYLHPEHISHWPALRAADPASRVQKELAIFNASHDQTARTLAEQWGLPQELSAALGDHHSYIDAPPDNAITPLCRILMAADTVAAVFTAQDKAAAIRKCRELLAAVYGMTAQEIAELLSDVPRQLNEAGTALGLGMAEQVSYDQILRQANIQLAEANLSYQELTWRLEAALRERDRLQLELDSEIELAKEIQRSLLPRNTGRVFPVAGINVAARQLSGDFYDFFALPDGRIYFNLGDVSGKGINAALLMAKVTSLFRCLGKQIDDPVQLLRIINNELCDTSVRGFFVTMVAGLYDPQTRLVKLVNAGHMPVVLLSEDHRFSKLEAQGPPLGIVPDTVLPLKQFQLAGSSLYLYSDGVTEGRTVDGQELGMKGLLNLLLKLAPEAPDARLSKIVELLTAQTTPLRDDITLVLVEDRHE